MAEGRMSRITIALRSSFSSVFGLLRRLVIRPEDVEGGSVLGQQPSFTLLWSYYDGTAFDNIGVWSAYRGQNRLYRAMRLLYNPTRRVCDFYAQHVYPGYLAADVSDLPEGVTLAIPLADTVTPDVRTALDVLWSWSNWEVKKNLMVRYGSIAGSVLVEVMDDVDNGMVYLNVVWPAMVSYLDLDPTGVVMAYVIQYMARNDDGTYYHYRKNVDADGIAYFKDDQPFDYGEGETSDLPYGFIPAVWIKHRDLGTNYGAPAIHAVIGKIDELNSLASHIHDQIHKVIGAPVVLWSTGKIGNLFSAKGQEKDGVTQPTDTPDLVREGILMLAGPTGGKVDSLAGNLQLHEAAEHLTMLLGEIEQDLPEVSMYRELRAMSQVTGPAASRIMGDVVANMDEASTNYDQGSARVFKMALAIGGMRASAGDWGPLTSEQSAFLPFTLEDLHTGSIPVKITPRALIQMSEVEKLELEQLRDSVKAGVQATLAANMRENVNG